MKILYLYAELMGYQIPIFKEYVEKYHADVHVVHWDHKKLTPYNPPKLENVTYYKRSEYTKHELIKLARNLAPDIAFISGWQDKHYLSVARYLRNEGVPVVAGFDDQWKSSFRQTIASVIFPLLLNIYFSHGWVTGPYQYEFARKIGFNKTQIIFNCCSADVALFNAAFSQSRKEKRQNYPHRFLYAGRFEHIKGIDLLVNAWQNLGMRKKDWELCFIGNGTLNSYLSQQSDITVMDFLQPDRLIGQIKDFGCFVLPSRSEPWAVVLHEFSAAGLPIICSDVCGAAPVFVTPGLNGYVFKCDSVSGLEGQLLKITNSSDQKLFGMSENAHKSGQKITPEISAASFLSILDSGKYL